MCLVLALVFAEPWSSHTCCILTVWPPNYKPLACVFLLAVG